MLIKCVHGFFKFYETESGQISKFNSLYGLEVVRTTDGFYTFSALQAAPDHSIKASTYLGAVATATFGGDPWDVMRANGLVYDWTTGTLKPLTQILVRAAFSDAGSYFVSSGLILPGSLASGGKRITDYTARLIWSSSKFRYTEIIAS